ncbi:MAG TPA: MdtA/MuxA family multidrug efflux RND transporter periplasmic adaptor subunit [Stellaceae bacterium]|nr:MdtA/MuxA family multidrug efflux RND transporter periplasmic adaptor subunit [Stellaceae bacterium]
MDELHPQVEETDEPADKPAARPDFTDPARGERSSLRPVLWIGLIIVVAAAFVVWLHSRPGPRLTAGQFAANAPLPVVEATATKGPIAITYNALGTVTPLATVTVQSQIAGQLVSVGFTEGQDVKKGDFLAQIDPRPYQAALDQYMGQLLRDQAILNKDRVDLARYQKLAAQNAIARQQAEDQKYVVDQDGGTVRVDQALVDNAKLNLSYCRIVSPITGRIGLREVDPGNYVQVGGTSNLAVITEMHPISVIFTLPEDELPAVMKRLNAGAKLPVTAYDRSGTTKLADGMLSAVDSEINTTTGTVNLRADFANPDEVLFPNQFVNARLLIDTLQNATVIPVAAVQRGQPGTFVFMVKRDDTVALTKITLGPQDGESVAVTKGLSPGDKVVVDGADKLRDGAKVVQRPESGSTAAAAPSPPPQGGATPPGQGQRGNGP